MSVNIAPKKFVFLPSLSFNGTLITRGFESPIEYGASYSVIAVALTCSVSTTLNIYNSNTGDSADRFLFFSTPLTAGENFYKKFAIAGPFYQIEVLNTTATEGDINLNCSAFQNTQFAASTFLNSSISVNDNTNLIRVANNFDLDLVRGLHQSFEKVNIQGIQKTIPTPGTEETIGLGRNYTLPANVVSNQVIANANDDPTGTGAQQIRYLGVLMDGTAFDSNFDTGAGTGAMGINIKTVNRAIVGQTGTGLKNAGLMEVEESTTGNVLCQVLTGENSSHCAYHGIESDKQLVIHDINIAGRSDATGIVKVIEMTSTGIEYTLGEFEINTSYQQFTYTLDGLIPSSSVVKVNFENTSATATGSILINVNVNAMKCPLINSF